MPSSFYLSQFAADKNDGMCRSGQTRRSGRGVAVGGQCGLPDVGQPVEFADLLVEDPGGGEAAQHADASGPRAGGVAQLRVRAGGCRDDGLAGDGGIVAVLHRRRQHVVEDAPLLRVDRQRSEEHTSELQSRRDLVCRLLLEKKKKKKISTKNTKNIKNTNNET